jgi:hypothetical protein
MVRMLSAERPKSRWDGMVDENGTVPFWNGAEEKHTIN